MIELKSVKQNYTISVPTDLSELTPEILSSITKGIKLPPYYAIVAICFHVKLSEIAVNVNNNKDKSVNVVTLLAKASEDDIAKVNTKIGDKLVLDRSTLERGVHLYLPISINSKNITKFIGDDDDLRKRLMRGGDGSEPIVNVPPITMSSKDKDVFKTNLSPSIYMLEFKIIPVNDISASIDAKDKTIDPFKKSILIN